MSAVQRCPARKLCWATIHVGMLLRLHSSSGAATVLSCMSQHQHLAEMLLTQLRRAAADTHSVTTQYADLQQKGLQLGNLL